jgi:hypothetical protein
VRQPPAAAPPPSGQRRPSFRALAEEFRQTGETLFAAAPLYRALCRGAAADERLLALAAAASPGQSPVLMLLGAVHFLVLRGARHPLSELYAEMAARRQPAAPAAPEAAAASWFALFRDFCLSREEEIRPLVARRVQTNEVGRSVFIRLALEWLALERPLGELSLVEIGASAGLNLCWDSFGMRLVFPGLGEDGREVVRLAGDRRSPVQLRCEVGVGEVGEGDEGDEGDEERPRRRPERPGRVRAALAGLVAGAALPPVVERLGMELEPPDLERPAEADWLRAFLWPEQPERRARFDAAVELGRRHRWPLVPADASRDLVRESAQLRADTQLCLVHTYLVTQLTRETRSELRAQIGQLARAREVIQIGVEEPDDEVLLTVTSWQAGEAVAEQVLGRCDPHGRRLDWRLGGV